MRDWFNFLVSCWYLVLGLWKGTYLVFDILIGLLWAIWEYRGRGKQFGSWEAVVRRLLKWGFIFVVVAGMFIYAPYRIYKNALEQYGSEGVYWKPPKIDWRKDTVIFLFGGHYNAIESTGTPIPLNIDQLRVAGSNIVTLKDMYGKEYPAIVAKYKHDRIYFDAEIPTGAKHIRIECGETQILPIGWDWNCDETALEVVDSQRRVIIRENFIDVNVIQIQGTIVFGHQTISTQDSGQIEVGINAGFDVSNFYLAPLFQYPSSDHKGERVK